MEKLISGVVLSVNLKSGLKSTIVFSVISKIIFYDGLKERFGLDYYFCQRTHINSAWQLRATN